LAQLLQAQPHHAIHKRLKLLRQLIRAKVEAPVRHQHHHGQVQHLRVQLEEAKALSAQTMLEPRLGVHLHLQQHHGPIRRANVAASGPERPIKAMVRRFELRRLKAIKRIARSVGPQRGSGRRSLRQQQGNQNRRALEQPVEPVIRFHGSTPSRQQRPNNGQPSNPTSA
jgi:hypothetical protein